MDFQLSVKYLSYHMKIHSSLSTRSSTSQDSNLFWPFIMKDLSNYWRSQITNHP